MALGFAQPNDLTADNDGYLAHARPIAEGRGYLGPYSNQPTAFRPPAYPLTLGFLIACGFNDPAAVAIINALSTLIILWFIRTLALQAGLSPGWSLVTSATAALDPLLVRYSILPMTEVPCAAILLAAVVAFRWRRTNDSTSAFAASCSGVCFGIGALVRPVVLISCALVTAAELVSSLMRWRSASRSSTTQSSRSSILQITWLVPAVVALLVLAPWIIRNAVHFQRFVPATTHGGYTLALGNNPDFYRDVINGADKFPWDGPSLDAWQHRMIDEILNEIGPKGTEPANDAWYYQQAFSAIRADIPSFLKSILLRLHRFWAVTTAEDQATGRVAIAVGIWYVWLWLGLAMERIAAWWLQNSHHAAQRRDLWLVVLSFMLMHSVYWTDTRMRAPIMPMLIVLSIAGWSTILRQRILTKADHAQQPTTASAE
jgi:hypothetical protein